MIKKVLKSFVPELLIKARSGYLSLRPITKRKCNICDYHGWFDSFGRPPRLDARCPKCGSLERHRLLMMALTENRISLDMNDSGCKVLHFAAEPILEKIFRDKFADYATADLFGEADLKLNMEKIELPSNSYKLIIANHVLEHVADAKAAKEISRILRDDGIFICMVPIVEGWEKTYENSSIATEEEKWIHFGQGDHVRFYGRDFRDRIEMGGLKLIDEVTAEGQNVIDYGLLRGEKVFVFSKSMT